MFQWRRPFCLSQSMTFSLTVCLLVLSASLATAQQGPVPELLRRIPVGPHGELPFQHHDPPALPPTAKSSQAVPPGTWIPATSGPPLSTATWTAVGPTSLLAGNGLVSGRITGVAVDPTNYDNIYIAAADGGIWQTTNGGTSWTPLTDNQPTLAMGAIAIAPSNHLKLYAGTGEANNGIDNIYGQGILVSDNGGASWRLSTGPSDVFSTHRFTISRISVDPTDANTAYAAVALPGQNETFYYQGGTGIYKTTDGGSHWALMTAAVIDGSGYCCTLPWTDVVVDPNTPAIIYAAIGTLWSGWNSGNGIYRSTDGGQHWALLTGGPHGGYTGRIALAVAPSAKSSGKHVLYVATENVQTGGLLFFGSSGNADAGSPTFTDSTWETPDFLGGGNGAGQGWYDIALGVDPSNSAIIYAAGVETYATGNKHVIVSTNGGSRWTDISTVGTVTPHTDSHAITFDSVGRMLLGTDGGLFRYDPAGPSWTVLNSNLNTIQFYGIGLDPNSASVMIGGSQDNGTEVDNGNLVWIEVQPGDGGFSQISQTSDWRCYASHPTASFHSQFFWRSDDSCADWNSETSGFLNLNSNFTMQFVVDPANGNHLALGMDRVYESTNEANKWVAISTPGSNGFNNKSGSTIYNLDTVAMAPGSPPPVIYAATQSLSSSSQSAIFVSTTDGAYWTEQDLPSCSTDYFNGCHVNQITVDPNDPSGMTAFAVTNQFSSTSSHVYRTINGGALWSDVSGNLPNLPTWSVRVDTDPGRTAYVSNDTAVYSAPYPYTTWTAFSQGLPNVQGLDLELNSNLHVLAVGTHGRGAWEILTATAVSNVTSSNGDGTYYPGDKIYIQVAFTTVVNVTGTPQLTLDTIPNAIANYYSGSGSNTLTFLYSVADPQTTDGNSTGGYLDYTSSSALSLNGGKVLDAYGIPASLMLYAPGAAGSLSANKHIVVKSGVLLSVSVSGNGTLVSGEIDCGTVCSYHYKQGTQVKVTAIPGAGYTLSSWTGCDTVQGDYCTVTMSGSRSISASFATLQVTLSSLTLRPATVKGGQMSVGTLTLGAPAPAGGVGVGISSDHPRVAHPPSLVVVPGGATSTRFLVRTSPVGKKTSVQITASANSSHTSATLTVNRK